MSNIINFPNNSGEGNAFIMIKELREAIGSMLANAPVSELKTGINTMARQKLGRIMAYLEISGHVNEVIVQAGFDPNDFTPDGESFDDFLIMDAEDYPADEMDDPDNMLNGPYYDWKEEDRVVRVATTVGFKRESVSAVAIAILELTLGAEHWKMLVDGQWVEGPEADEFGDDPFEEEDDWDDWDEDDDDYDEDDEDDDEDDGDWE